VDEGVGNLDVDSAPLVDATGCSWLDCGVFPKTAPSTKSTAKAERAIIIQRGIRFSREGRTAGSVCMGVLGVMSSGELRRFLSFIRRKSLQAPLFRHEVATNGSPSMLERYADGGVAIHR
jgi:hypothetical protein